MQGHNIPAIMGKWKKSKNDFVLCSTWNYFCIDKVCNKNKSVTISIAFKKELKIHRGHIQYFYHFVDTLVIGDK